jgi:hypothetical protein
MIHIVDIETALLTDFRKEAGIIFRKYGHRIDWSKPACTWGGCFTALPNNITFNDVNNVLEDNN